MDRYHIVAFYLENETEISKYAEAVSRMYHLPVRYERMPRLTKSVAVLLSADTVFCMLSRTAIGFRWLMRYVYALDRPVIVVHPDASLDAYGRLKLLVGYQQEEKEKVVWANFFRHNHFECQIELAVPTEKDEGIADKVRNNTEFIEQVLKKSDIPYRQERLGGSFEKNLKLLLQREDTGLLFLMRPFSFFPFYLPYPIRLLRKYARTPVLIIPRDDKLYVPCH